MKQFIRDMIHVSNVITEALVRYEQWKLLREIFYGPIRKTEPKPIKRMENHKDHFEFVVVDDNGNIIR